MIDARKLALEFPETEENLNANGHPSFSVREGVFAILDPDERGLRVKAATGWVTTDLSQATAEELTQLLEDAWRLAAPRNMVRAFDETAI